MNNRIKELYLHAFPPSLNDSTICQMSAEKFAALIIEDCALAAERHSRSYADGDAASGCYGAASAVRAYGRDKG